MKKESARNTDDMSIHSKVDHLAAYILRDYEFEERCKVVYHRYDGESKSDGKRALSLGIPYWSKEKKTSFIGWWSEKRKEVEVKLKFDLSSLELQEVYRMHNENSKVLADDESVRDLAEELSIIRNGDIYRF